MSAPPGCDAVFAMDPIIMGRPILRADWTAFPSPPTDLLMRERLSPVATCFIRSATMSIMQNNTVAVPLKLSSGTASSAVKKQLH
jgi:hypothetical protein